MKEFYAEALNSGNAPESLADVQRDWLLRLRAEEGLQYSVDHAGAFIMSSQGKQ